MQNNEILNQIIKLIIISYQKQISDSDQFYLLVLDSMEFFNSLETPKYLNFLGKDILIRKINYYNQFEIEEEAYFEEITDEAFILLFFRYGKNVLKEKFEDFKLEILDFSILNVIISIFDFEIDQHILKRIEEYKDSFLNEDIFKDLCESLNHFQNNQEELNFLRDLKLDSFFNILFLFFANQFFIDIYYKTVLSKFENFPDRNFFEVSTPYELIEMLFYLKTEVYNPDLLSLCLNFLDIPMNEEFQTILNIVKMIVGTKETLQNFLKNVFLIDLFQLKCGRGAFKLGQEDLDIFNRKSKDTLKSIFQTINQFCRFSDNYIELLFKPDFKDFLRKNYVIDFEKKYKNEEPDFKLNFIDSITKENLFHLENQSQTYFFYDSYQKWIKTLCQTIFHDIAQIIQKRLTHIDAKYEDLSKNVIYFLQNISRIEAFYHYRDNDKKILENLLFIMKISIEIIEDLKSHGNSMQFWLKSQILEKIYDLEKNFREIREIYVNLEKSNPLFSILKENINANNSFLNFNEVINNFCFLNFFSIIKKDYFKELQNQESQILFTKDVSKLIKEDLEKPEQKLILIIADGLRFDFWNAIWKEFLYKYHLKLEKREKMFSLLPSITEVSRESMFFNKVKANPSTDKQIIENFKKLINKDKINYISLPPKKEIVVGELQEVLDLDSDLNIIITPYPDHRIHKIENSEELYNNKSYNQIVEEIKLHLNNIFKAIFESITNELNYKRTDFKIIVISDHGFIDFYEEIKLRTKCIEITPEIFLKGNRYLRCKKDPKEFLDFSNQDLNKLFNIPIQNENYITYIVPFGRYYFVSTQEREKKTNKVGHGGISYYENIVPFHKLGFIDAERQKYHPSIVFLNKDEIYLSTNNQIEFLFSNEDPNFPINIKAIIIKFGDSITLFEEKFNNEECLIMGNGSSKEFHFNYLNNNDKFKLNYTIYYSFIDNRGNQTNPLDLKGFEEFIQVIVQNPDVQIKQAPKKDIIKGQYYCFEIKIYNPNEFSLENVKLNFKSSKNIDLIIKVFEEINHLFFNVIEPNKTIKRKMLIAFKEKCQMDLESNGSFMLSNLTSKSFKVPNKLSLDVFDSEDDLNRQRSFIL